MKKNNTRKNLSFLPDIVKEVAIKTSRTEEEIYEIYHCLIDSLYLKVFYSCVCNILIYGIGTMYIRLSFLQNQKKKKYVKNRLYSRKFISDKLSMVINADSAYVKPRQKKQLRFIKYRRTLYNVRARKSYEELEQLQNNEFEKN